MSGHPDKSLRLSRSVLGVPVLLMRLVSKYQPLDSTVDRNDD